MRAAMCLAVMTLAFATGAGAQSTRDRLSQSERALFARLLLMTDTRTLDTSVVDQALASTSDALAKHAALAVGQLGRVEAAPRISRLRDLVVGPRKAVAANAAYALGLLRDTVSAADLAVALRGDPLTAAEAAWALGQIGEPARDAIISVVGEANLPSGVRVQLLLAAAKLRPVPLDAVTPHLRSEDGAVAWAAAYSIARPRVAGGVRALLDAESLAIANRRSVRGDSRAPSAFYQIGSSAPHRIRAEIARAISFQAAGDSLADRAFAALSRLARDAHAHVRINAFRSLASYEARALTVLLDGVADRDPNVRIAAVQALGSVRVTAPIDWTRLWTVDTGFTFRRSLLAASLAHGASLAAVQDWSTQSSWRHRAAVAAAGDSIRDHAAAHALLIPFLRDVDARVRSVALGSLTGDSVRVTDSVRSLAVAALRDPDEAVRAVALSALARAPRSADIPAVVAFLERSAEDREPDARVAALRYLAVAWRRDSSAFGPDLRASLAALPASPDPVTRAAATDLPPLAAWHAVRIQPRPGSWYRDVVDRIVAPTLAGRPPTVVLRTSRGLITLEMFGANAPLTVENFVGLARRGFYNGLTFHRIVPNFVVQDGDPRGDGGGGPGYAIRDELNPERYARGVLGMALSGPDTGGSQYFITHSPQPHLDGGYTTFGRVVAGFNALDALVQEDRIVRVDVR